MLHFSNGETAEYIDVMYCDSVVARIDYNKGKFSRINYLEGSTVHDFIRNPLVMGFYNNSREVEGFLNERRIAEGRMFREMLFPDWVKTPLDELFLTNGRDFDDDTWLRFMPTQAHLTYDYICSRASSGVDAEGNCLEVSCWNTPLKGKCVKGFGGSGYDRLQN